MNFDEIMTILIKIVIIPLLTWGVATLIKLADAKIAQVKNETIRKALVAARLELTNAIVDAVGFAQETFVNALEDPTNLTKEQAEMAFRIAFDRTKAIMSNASMDVLQIATGALNELIEAEIEAILPVVKNDSLCLKANACEGAI